MAKFKLFVSVESDNLKKKVDEWLEKTGNIKITHTSLTNTGTDFTSDTFLVWLAVFYEEAING